LLKLLSDLRRVGGSQTYVTKIFAKNVVTFKGPRYGNIWGGGTPPSGATCHKKTKSEQRCPQEEVQKK